LVPLIKILKSWKREKCGYLKSFHLELLAVEILGCGPIEDYSQGIAIFFFTAGSYLQETCLKDPANNDNVIDEYLDRDGTRNRLLNIVAQERSTAERAIESEASGDEENAIEE
jgi:low affinity Fe/Cu permease